ncbi:MAG TPA: peroxidase-related enzyme [Alphaproteobacteria bacterium]|nr:peroxidase-related enzyme [Alphaproteobacteria bacterium]
MPFFPTFPQDADTNTIFGLCRERYAGWFDFSERLMRGPSPLTPAERELIAGYTSVLNACDFCFGTHTAIAIAFGLDESLLESLKGDIDRAEVPERMRPILRYVRKLTQTPSRLTQADADEVFAAGWDERALHDAITVCARFNFMNRMVMGHGIVAEPEKFMERGRRKAEDGYRRTADTETSKD